MAGSIFFVCHFWSLAHEGLILSALNENTNMRTKVYTIYNTVQKSTISTVPLQIGGFIMNLIGQWCLANMLAVRICDNDAPVCICKQETGHHNLENLKQMYKFIINLVSATKSSFHRYYNFVFRVHKNILTQRSTDYYFKKQWIHI
jgi:hypothetical protein